MEIRPLENDTQMINVHMGVSNEYENNHDNDYAYKIINIVGLGILTLRPDFKITFEEIEKRIQVKRLNRFPCVMFKVENVSIILFKNGKMIITGIKSENEISELKTKIRQHLTVAGISFIDFEIKIQNLVAMTQLGKIINLELACLTLTNCLYEPEQFPAAIVKPIAGGTFLIFSNSKIIGLGMRNQNMLEDSLRGLIQEIFDFGLFINTTNHTIEEFGEEFEKEIF